MMFHGSQEQNAPSVMHPCQFEDIAMYCEANRIASSLELPSSIIQDAMAVHALAKEKKLVAGLDADPEFVSASCLYLACKMRGRKVYMSRFIDISNMHPLHFRRTMIHISRAVKLTRMDQEHAKEQIRK